MLRLKAETNEDLMPEQGTDRCCLVALRYTLATLFGDVFPAPPSIQWGQLRGARYHEIDSLSILETNEAAESCCRDIEYDELLSDCHYHDATTTGLKQLLSMRKHFLLSRAWRRFLSLLFWIVHNDRIVLGEEDEIVLLLSCGKELHSVTRQQERSRTTSNIL